MNKFGSIFVMIPAYKDPVLEETLDTIFEFADFPDRVFVAVGAQYESIEDISFLSKYPSSNLRYLYFHPNNRPGVYRLRHILNKLYINEEYYLSVDSHTIFKNSWDTKLINMLESQDHPATIIAGYEPGAVSPEDTDYEFCQLKLDTRYPELGPRLYLPGSERRPYNGESYTPAHYLQAGLFFTRGSFAHDIRWGELWQNEQEEPFLSFEAFMKGYNILVNMNDHPFKHDPDKYYNVVYNAVPDSPIRNFKDSWTHQPDDRPTVSKNIIQAMLYNEGPYKINNPVRSVSDWWEFIGMKDVYLNLLGSEQKL